MKLRCTPSERWIPEQSMHRNTPYEMLAQLGFLAAQSKHTCWKEEILALEEEGSACSPEQRLVLGGGDASASSLKHLHVFTLRLTDGKKISRFTFELAPTPMKGRGQLTGHLRQVRHPA